MSTELRTLYRNATDFITFVKLDAPNFAPSDQLTCDRAIARIRKYLDDIRDVEKNEAAIRWLKLCNEDVSSAERFFNEGKDADGRKTLDSARGYLMNAASKKAMDAKFIAGESGAVQDSDSGFPA